MVERAILVVFIAVTIARLSMDLTKNLRQLGEPVIERLKMAGSIESCLCAAK